MGVLLVGTTLFFVTSELESTPTDNQDSTPSSSQVKVQTSNGARICIERSKELDNSWPIDEAVVNWNANGKNLFTMDLYQCTGVVIITQSDTTKWYGSTEFYGKSIINVQLSTTTPDNRRLSVACHELGHVLGRPHSKGDNSCMDPSQNNPKPTEKNLTAVSQDVWAAETASHTIGHK